MTAEFFGQVAGLFSCAYQFDHSRALLRRVWRFGIAVVTHLDSFLT